MKKLLIALALVLLSLTLTTAALADRMFIFPESGTRRLTRQEVEQWNYESLGFAFHEILARHGFVFNPSGSYYAYFNSKPWYTPNADPDNDRACYPKLSSIEWDNYRLIRAVRAEKEYRDYGLSIWDYHTGGIRPLQGFTYVPLAANQVLPVYAAPGTSSYRAAMGLAEVSTNGAVYAAGVENGWMLILYETNFGGCRVGYINTAALRGNVPCLPRLNFQPALATVQQRCSLTDDPLRGTDTVCYLQPGATVTWLASFDGMTSWDYIECSLNGTTVRGFIPAGMLDTSADDGPVLLY